MAISALLNGMIGAASAHTASGTFGNFPDDKLRRLLFFHLLELQNQGRAAEAAGLMFRLKAALTTIQKFRTDGANHIVHAGKLSKPNASRRDRSVKGDQGVRLG